VASAAGEPYRLTGSKDRVTVAVPIDAAVFDLAAELEPPQLRSLDAIHLATLLSLAGDVSDLYCSDGWLASAAEAAGANVLMPGSQQ